MILERSSNLINTTKPIYSLKNNSVKEGLTITTLYCIKSPWDKISGKLFRIIVESYTDEKEIKKFI